MFLRKIRDELGEIRSELRFLRGEMERSSRRWLEAESKVRVLRAQFDFINAQHVHDALPERNHFRLCPKCETAERPTLTYLATPHGDAFHRTCVICTYTWTERA